MFKFDILIIWKSIDTLLLSLGFMAFCNPQIFIINVIISKYDEKHHNMFI